MTSVDWDGIRSSDSGPVNFAALYDDWVDLLPEKIAIYDDFTDEYVTYQQLSERVAKAGHILQTRGVDRRDRVGLFFSNDLEYLYYFFGAMRIGAVPVPVNTELPVDSLSYIVRDCDTELIVSTAIDDVIEKAIAAAMDVSFDGDFLVHGTPRTVDERITTHNVVPEFERAGTDLEPVAVKPEDEASQPYTSGSTGKPKGVVLTHGGMGWNNAVVRKTRLIDRTERGLTAAPLYHKNAMVSTVKPLLSVGGSLVLQRSFDPEAYIRAIDHYDVTYITGVPAMYQFLLDAEEALEQYDTSSVNFGTCGSDVVPDRIHERFEEAFDAKLLETYGLTEGGPVVTSSPRWGPRKVGSTGLSLPDVDTMIVDTETNEPVGPNETGELLVSNPGTASYYEKPEQTANAFEKKDGIVYLHTGDLAYRDEQGYHYIVGRVDDMMIVGGENLYPTEVESLLESHPQITNVVVISHPHETKGEAPVAFVEATDLSATAVKEYALEHGPAYAHPRAVFFVDEYPLTGTSKIDRDALRDRAAAAIDGKLG